MAREIDKDSQRSFFPEDRSFSGSMHLLYLQNPLGRVARRSSRAIEVELDQVAARFRRVRTRHTSRFGSFRAASYQAKTGEKRAPRAIAEALKSGLERIDEVARVELPRRLSQCLLDRARMLSDGKRPHTKNQTDGAGTSRRSAAGRKLMLSTQASTPTRPRTSVTFAILNRRHFVNILARRSRSRRNVRTTSTPGRPLRRRVVGFIISIRVADYIKTLSL